MINSNKISAFLKNILDNCKFTFFFFFTWELHRCQMEKLLSNMRDQ